MPTAACYKHVENTIDRFSVVGTFSSNDGLRWNTWLDKLPLFMPRLRRRQLMTQPSARLIQRIALLSLSHTIVLHQKIDTNYRCHEFNQ